MSEQERQAITDAAAYVSECEDGAHVELAVHATYEDGTEMQYGLFLTPDIARELAFQLTRCSVNVEERQLP